METAYPSTTTPTSTAPTLWIRNPEFCIHECIEESVFNFVWDGPYLHKRSLDPVKFAETWCTGFHWRTMTVFDSDDTALETRWDGTRVLHDVWAYGDELANLEECLANNAGTDRMVVIMRIPDLRDSISKAFVRMLSEMRKDYPTSPIHIHALYGWSWLFGFNWSSVDIDPRAAARGGQVHMPNGKRVKHQRVSEMPEWVNVVGMRVRDLQTPRLRCIFNIRSAQWAAVNYNETPLFATRFTPVRPGAAIEGRRRRVFFRYVEPEDGDKLACDTCSLAVSCRYYREGAVCAVPDSDLADLADYFNTRDADAIIEGLGDLLASQMLRLQNGMELESKKGGDLSPAVTTLFDKIFKDGVTLAKLINPMLAKPALQINVANAGDLPSAGNKQALMAAVIGELEARGVARADITEEMVTGLLEERAAQVALG
jgi:hypothetical protein